MKEKTLIFLRPLTNVKPTLNYLQSFMCREICAEVVCREYGQIYNHEMLKDRDISRFIRQEIENKKPEWIIAHNECATAVLSLRIQKKILINPKVGSYDLVNITDFARKNTYGFFDNRHKKNYELFQSIYPHATFQPESNDMNVSDIHLTVKEIITGIVITPKTRFEQVVKDTQAITLEHFEECFTKAIDMAYELRDKYGNYGRQSD